MRASPKAVLISDIHYGLSTLLVADAALRQACEKAAELSVPLVIAGDLHDTKALLRGECVNTLVDTFKWAQREYRIILLVGNHDLIHEKSEEHSLNFLSPYANIVSPSAVGLGYYYSAELNIYFIPYQHDPETFVALLSRIPKDATVIAHQGVTFADMGSYVQDKSAVSAHALAGYRIISGHYHKAQDIECGDGGLFSYVGSPYTISFAEAGDGPKGYRVLYSDGSLLSVPTNLRKHVIVHRLASELGCAAEGMADDDLVWVKITGRYSELEKISKKDVSDRILGGRSDFKLDKICTDRKTELLPVSCENGIISEAATLDKIIDSELAGESEDERVYLKRLWREIVSTEEGRK